MSSLGRKLKRLAGRKGIEIQQERPRRVSICVPVGDTVHTAFSVSLLQMCMHTLESGPTSITSINLQHYASSILPFSRNVIAKAALESGATHLLWIDSDMEFAPDMLIRLIAHELPIVSINATSRRPPYMNTARVDGGKELTTSMDSSGLEKVERTGFGVALIEADVFRALELPWFAFEWLPEQCVFRGEDYYFFNKAKAAGFEVYVDQDVSKTVRHIGTFGYSPVIKAVCETMKEKVE